MLTALTGKASRTVENDGKEIKLEREFQYDGIVTQEKKDGKWIEVDLPDLSQITVQDWVDACIERYPHWTERDVVAGLNNGIFLIRNPEVGKAMTLGLVAPASGTITKALNDQAMALVLASKFEEGQDLLSEVKEAGSDRGKVVELWKKYLKDE